jgi:hypothetical protein
MTSVGATKLKYAVLSGLAGGLLGWATDVGKEYVTGNLEQWRSEAKYDLLQETLPLLPECSADKPPSGSIGALAITLRFRGPGELKRFGFRPQPMTGWRLVRSLPPEEGDYNSGRLTEITDNVTKQSIWQVSQMSPGGAFRFRFCYASDSEATFSLSSVRLTQVSHEASVDGDAREVRDTTSFPWWVRHFGSVFLCSLIGACAFLASPRSDTGRQAGCGPRWS